MKKRLGWLLATLTAIVLFQVGVSFPTVVCTPLGSLTANLQLCKPASGEIGWDASVVNNFDVLDALMVSTQASVTASPPGAAQTNLITHYFNATPSTASTQHIGGAFGITTSASGSAGHIAFYAGAQTRPADLGTGQLRAVNVGIFNGGGDATHTFLIAQETDVGSNLVDSALNCVPPDCIIGHSIISNGSKKASYAINVAGTGQWQQGYEIDQGVIATGGYAFNYKGNGTQGAFQITEKSALAPGAFVFANIAAVLTANGQMGYCSDCKVTTGTPGNPSTITNNTCTSGGNGSLVVRLNGVNVCIQ